MDDQKDEDFEQEFDENGFDPTKEAFFADLLEMEEEVAAEAYELVEHAMHLVETKYFDDSIEVLRQAIGLYTQINRVDEIKAISEKISDVYLLKEQAFRESEGEAEIETTITEEVAPTIEIDDSVIESESIQEEIEVDSIITAERLIKAGSELLDNNKFEEALDLYDRVVEIFEEVNNPEGVDRVFKLIEDCYNRKADYLRSIKTVTSEVEEDEEKEIVVEPKEEKLQQYLSAKKKEEEISSKAYDLLGKASELAKSKEYDESLRLYKEGARLFGELNWTYEVKKVQDTIIQLENEKSLYLQSLEERKRRVEGEVKPEISTLDSIEQQVKEREEQEREEKLERLRSIELQKMENEYFKAQIDNMATEASRMAREYELAMKKAIKKGELIEECIYPKVIQIYEKIKDLLIDRGWGSEATIYDDTIQVYYQKLEQDKNIRQIEAEKIRKQKEAEQYLKVKEEVEISTQSEAQLKAAEKQREKIIEVQRFRTEIDELTSRAEKLAREYEVALRKGKFELHCPYPEIIKNYNIVMQKAQERGWETDVAIFMSQIQVFTDKLEKDKKLRQIEAEKAQKQKDMEEMLKVQRKDGLAELKEVAVEKTSKKEVKEEFEQLINDMINKAETLAREYDLAMKKAVRQGKLANNPPFAEIIKIYERARQMSVAKERTTEAAAYTKQIEFYSQKWDKDKKLREIEAQKAEKQKQIEEMHKIGKDKASEIERAEIIKQPKGDEEEFERYIINNINKAEKLVRDHEIEMRKAMRKGEILEDTPYSEVLEIYRELREKVYARGWIEQAEVYANQIKIYQEKLEKHVKLLETELKKVDKQKEIEELHKVGKDKVSEIEKLRKIEELKGEEEDFEQYITDNINKAERLVRDHESAMRRAVKKGEILEETPYLEVIDIYKDIRQKVYARGWKEQAEIYGNQIKIYQEKLDMHVKLLEVEVQKAERQKKIDQLRKSGKEIGIDQKKMKAIEIKKEEEEFQKYITSLVDKAAKLERDYDSALKKAIKKGEILDQTPYQEIIEIYKQIRKDVIEKGWGDQAPIFTNQIKMYEEKLEKSEKLRQVEAQKAKRQKEIEDMYKIKEDFKPAKPEKIKELEEGVKEEDYLLDKAMSLIDKAEKLVKNYEISIKTNVLLYESPYDKAISNYQEAKIIFQDIGWNDEAGRLINTIKFYEDKKEKDEKLRQIEKKKLEEPAVELRYAKDDTEKALIARERRVLELEKAEKEKNEVVEQIFRDIHKAEKIAQEYDVMKKESILDHEAPYEEIIRIYREAKKKFEEIGWLEESMKLINTIKFYKEKQESDNKLRALEGAKVKKQEEELLQQQLLIKQAKEERERILKQRRESRIQKEKKVFEIETSKSEAFTLMDKAKNELNLNNFDQAIEYYKESEEIFTEISWQEGINMVKDSIAMIKRKKQSFELEQARVEKERIERLKIEDQLEQKFAKAEELRKLQQEEKRKELLKVQREKQMEMEISTEAFKLLEQGTSLMDDRKFEEAYNVYMRARDLFNQISWKREVSRINNDLLFKLKRERQQHEALEAIKKKKAEEEAQMEKLRFETERERRDLRRQKKEEKRKLAKKELDKKIYKELEKAEYLIEEFNYNEGIILLKQEVEKLEKSKKDEEVKRITEMIDDLKEKTEVPLVSLEPLSEIENLEKFENTYKALDKAQVSLRNNQVMKAISEFNEAKSNLLELKIGKKYINLIDNKVRDLQTKLGKKPVKDDLKAKEKEHEAEMELLKSRIAARREERRKKVLDLLKKD
ncbi:MAG: hypothetical protein ACFFDB_16950 [Promethearchaeota archaeon]